MDCPVCTYPMTQVPFLTRHIYAADVQHARYRCEVCKVSATIETVFTRDEEPAHAVSAESP